MEKKQASPLLWLLLIPGQLIAGVLFFMLGITLDRMIFSNSGQGHGMPIFSVLFLLIAAVVTLIVIVLSIVLVIRGYRKRRK